MGTVGYLHDRARNLSQQTTGSTSTLYSWDYLNRLASSTSSGQSTIYGYDAFGNRVFQTTGNTTTVYPSKYYSVVTTSGATSTGTSTDYIFLPTEISQDNRLLATVDQPLVNGSPTGSSTTRYIHADNLGSTQVTSDAYGNLAAFYDYAPYGSVLASTNTGTTTTARQFIGQFSDASGLSYLQARYYDSARAQFLSEDAVFLALGSPSQAQQLSEQDHEELLSDPQQLNPYSYSRDNPITNEDPQGLWAWRFGVSGTIPGWGLSGEAGVEGDLQGIEYYYGAGYAAGGGVAVGPEVTTADLSHQYSIETLGFGEGGAGPSVEVSKGMTYYPYSNREPEGDQEATFGFPAVELSGGGMAEVSGPIPFLTWAAPNTGSPLPQPQIVSHINFVTPSQSFNSSSGTGSASYQQTLSSLQSAVQQLSAALSTYKSGNSH